MKRRIRPLLLALLLIALTTLFGACSPQPGNPSGTVPASQPAPVGTAAGNSQTLPGTAPAETDPAGTGDSGSQLAAIPVAEDGRYTSKMEVAAYLYQFGRLPSNYLTKEEARDLGWVASRGNLWDVTDEMSIGGDRFGNFEGLLPEKKGRQYYECDIDYRGGSRGARRIVYSNDGLIFYTDDHYESFERLE